MTDKSVLLDLESAGFQAMALRYSAVVNLVLWLYDYSLTFDKETRLLWPSRFTIIKLLFFANRYLPLFVTSANAYFLILNNASNANLCKPALLVIGFMSFASFLLAEAVLVLRVYVIWQARKSILVLIICVFTVKTGVAFVITYFALTSAIMSPINLFHSGCECIITKRIEWITMLLIFSFEILILPLMVIGKRVYLGRSRSELVNILVKDGVLYCLCIMAVSLVNVLVVGLAPPILSFLLVVTQGTIHNILCTRLLLRLRDADPRRTSILALNNHIPLGSASSGSRNSASQ